MNLKGLERYYRQGFSACLSDVSFDLNPLTGNQARAWSIGWKGAERTKASPEKLRNFFKHPSVKNWKEVWKSCQ